MAFRSAPHWKTMVNKLRESPRSYLGPSFTTSTLPKMKAYSPDAHPSSSDGSKSKWPKGDFFPVYMAVGMITLSCSFGLFTAWHELGHGPNLYVRKSRRETVPEVVDPDHVLEEADKFVKRSFFRKVAHIQNIDRQEVMPDPIRGDVYTKSPKAETLKGVGVDPAAT